MSTKDNEMSSKIDAVKSFIYNDEVQNILSDINNNVMDFNILEITGMGHHEIRHSNIIGWLFDDSEHGLEYEVLEDFLKKVIELNSSEESSNSKVLDSLQAYVYLADNQKNITIYREKDNIDLLIVDDANKVVITIENKVFSSERTTGTTDDGQLSKYEEIVNQKFKSKANNSKSGYDKYFIFLTMNLEEPIKGQEYWMKASHQMIASVVENMLTTKQELSKKAKLIFESYVDLLKRRGIVEDEALAVLANKIWSNKDYKKALETLYEYKPDIQMIISEHLQKVLNGEVENLKFINDYVNFEASSKSYIRFSDIAFDDIEGQKSGEKQWNSKIERVLVYEFNNLANSLSLDLIVGPGSNPDIRQKFYDVQLGEKYNGKAKKFDKEKKSWSRLFKMPIQIDDIYELDENEIKEKLDEFCRDFFKKDGDFFTIRNQILKSLKEDLIQQG